MVIRSCYYTSIILDHTVTVTVTDHEMYGRT